MLENVEDVFGDVGSDPASEIATQLMARGWTSSGHVEGDDWRYGDIQEVADPIIKAALATAVARARREALEEAAGIADAKAGFWEREDYPFRARGARSVALDIRALAATPPEARQTETAP